MNYLIDTNIWLERLLDQEKSDIVSVFLDIIPLDQVFISDFTLHSIGVILSKFNRWNTLEKFIDDIFITGKIEQIGLSPIDVNDLINNSKRYNLDFDDLYQVTVSQKYNMIIVTFDKDFNAIGIKKATPEEIIRKIKSGR